MSKVANCKNISKLELLGEDIIKGTHNLGGLGGGAVFSKEGRVDWLVNREYEISQIVKKDHPKA